MSMGYVCVLASLYVYMSTGLQVYMTDVYMSICLMSVYLIFVVYVTAYTVICQCTSSCDIIPLSETGTTESRMSDS